MSIFTPSFDQLTGVTIAAALTIAFIVYGVALAIYRLFFHPLSKIPGPWLAAATQWYETYYELVPNGGGMFTKSIKKMHDQYGEFPTFSWSLFHLESCNSDSLADDRIHRSHQPQRSSY